MTKFDVEFIDNSSAWLKNERTRLYRGARKMGQAIINLADIKVPRKYGTLAKSAHIESNLQDTIYVVYGNSEVDYAMVQEQGHRGGVYFKHYTTPETGPHYLESSGDTVAKKGIAIYL